MTPCDYNKKTTRLSNQTTTLPTATRLLDLSNRYELFHDFKIEQQNLLYIKHLNISFCKIYLFPAGFFSSMSRLKVLDISHNQIKRLVSNMFSNLNELESFVMIGNSELLTLESECFSGLSSLRHLRLTDLHIEHISENAFSSLNLREMKIYSSVIDSVESNFIANLHAEGIYFNSTKINTFTGSMFQGSKEISVLVTDDYKFCCVRPSSVTEENCFPRKTAFLSCTDLVTSELLRPFIWLSGLFIILSNAISLIYRVLFQREQFKHCYCVFVSNLALSDLLMGIYQIIIASADTLFRGKYIFHEASWRHSGWCKLAGVVSTMSSEASQCFICLITLDRFLVIKYPFRQRHITLRTGIATTLVLWVFSLFIAVLPEMIESFHGEFYSQSGLCLALPITRDRPPAWGYSFGIFIVFNSVLFLMVSLGQWKIYMKIQASAKALAGSRSKTTNNIRIALNLLLVAATDSLCWFTIGLLGKLI